MVSERQKGERSELERSLRQVEAEEALVQARRMSQALNRINTVLHSSLHIAEIMQLMVTEGSIFLGSDSAAISLRQGDGWTVSHVYRMPSSNVGKVMEDDKERHAVLALQSRQPVVVSDAFNDDRFDREHLRRHNIRAVLVAPLVTRKESLGAIFFNYHTSPHEFTDGEVNFARQLATTASIALENAKLFEEHRQMGEALRQLNETLEQQIAERTRELAAANEQLKGVIRKREQLAQNLQLEVEERKKIEGVLRESEELFRRTFDEAPIGAAIISTDFRFKRVNSALCSITGYSQEELESLSFLDITHPEDRAENLIMAQKLASGELRDYQLEKRYIRKDGKIVWVRASIKVMRDEAGKPIYYLPMTEDITERKKVEIDLRESEEKYRLLIQSLPGVVYKGQKDWSVEFFDEKAERFTGYKVEEYSSGRKKWSELILEEDLHRAKEAFIRALKTDRSFIREYRIRCMDGNICWVQDRGTIVCDEKGDILYVNGVFFDVTERKKLDEQLLEHQGQLRSMASELALTEERQRRDLAQDLHDSIGQTLALSKLRVDSMRCGEVASKISPELEGLSRNLEDAIEQTQSLIFRLSPPVLYQVGLGEALEYLAELMEKSYGVPIAVSSELDSLPLPEDESVLLFRAVQELLINIVKHAKASKSSVTLKGSDDHVQIEVRDDGVGFDPARLKGEEAREERFGLFSIRERLQHLGGHMQIDSSPGGGTKVNITAPLPTVRKIAKVTDDS